LILEYWNDGMMGKEKTGIMEQWNGRGMGSGLNLGETL
jgi:hypothetical protein